VIRLLQAKYKRKFEVAINPGNEQTTPVVVGPLPWYPDLVLQSTDRGRKLLGTVEVETAESVNNLEAMSQWATFSRLRAPFHLYIPASSIDTAKRLCAALQITVAEIWAYNPLGDQMRFTLVQRSAARSSDGKGRAAATPRAASPAKAPRPAASSRARSGRPSASPAARTAPRKTAEKSKTAEKKSVARVAGARKKASVPSRTQKRK
jgi:hypothetical protein